MAEAVAEEYRSSLSELSFNSKPHINMLTMLAEDNIQHAPLIVDTIVEHVSAVSPEMKLPSLYLVDSIIKNIGGLYVPLFCKNLIFLFTSVFEKVEEATRSLLFKLRLTWKDIIPNKILHQLDTKVNELDPAWPIVAAPPVPTIHVNPKFFEASNVQLTGENTTPSLQQLQEKAEENELKRKQMEILKILESKKEQLRNLELKKLAVTAKQKQLATSSISPSAQLMRGKKLPLKEIVRENDLKKKQVDILKMLEAKKEHLKNLESKKKAAAAKEKQLTPVTAASTISPVVQKSVNIRDPRLKKNIPALQNPAGEASSGSVSLQSVVVVPKTKLPTNPFSNSEELSHSAQKETTEDKLSVQNLALFDNGKRKLPLTTPSKKHKSDVSNKILNDSLQEKYNSNNVDEKKRLNKSMNENIQDKSKTVHKRDNLDKMPFNGSSQNSNKRSLSPENQFISGTQGNKLPFRSSVQSNMQGNISKRKEHIVMTKHKSETVDPVDKLTRNLDHRQEKSPMLFGGEDKDYRQHDNVDPTHLIVKNPEPGKFRTPKLGIFPSRLESDEKFYNQRESIYKGKGNQSFGKSVMPNPYAIMRDAEEKYHMGRISKFEYQNLCNGMQHMMGNKGFQGLESDNPNFQSEWSQRYEHPEHKNPPQFTQNCEGMIDFPNQSGRRPMPMMKSFKLDNKVRTIYFVNDQAFAVMDDNEPRELTFSGYPRNVQVEGLMQPITLDFTGKIAEFQINGMLNTMKFGTPAREIYINNIPYEAQFGGPPICAVMKDGKMHRIRIEGPPPQVVISAHPANDLFKRFHQDHESPHLLEVPNENLNPETLECKASLHDVDMRMKANNVKYSSVVFDSVPENSKDIDWRQKNLPELPKNSFETCKEPGVDFFKNRIHSDPVNAQIPTDWKIRPPSYEVPKMSTNFEPPALGCINSGSVPVTNRCDLSTVPRNPNLTTPVLPSQQPQINSGYNMSQNSSSHTVGMTNFSSVTSSIQSQMSYPCSDVKISQPVHLPFIETLPPAVTTTHNHQPLQNPSQINVPTTTWQPLPPPPMFPGPIPKPENSVPPVLPALTETVPSLQPVASSSVPVPNIAESVTSAAQPVLKVNDVNFDAFLEKLVAAGIIGKKKQEPVPPTCIAPNSPERVEEEKKESLEDEPIPEISWDPKILKEFHFGIISALYKGTQCATCGMRFKEIESEQYSRHLDWHFRMNRKEKDGAKKPFSRRLFYEIKDWIQFKEFEDFEERTPSYFELQATGDQTKDEPESIHSVPSIKCETETCAVCGEQFQLFWVEEEEEWHLKHAVRHVDQVYHPACYEDFKKANELSSSKADSVEAVDEEQVESNDKKPPDCSFDESADDNKVIKCEEVESMETESEKLVEVKVEPADAEQIETNVSEETNVKEQAISESTSETNESQLECTVKLESNESTVPLTNVKEEPNVQSELTELTSQCQNELQNSDEEEDFRPPTPDPRFQNLPPVSKGTELSALCCIM